MEKENHRRGIYYVMPAAVMDTDEITSDEKILYILLSGLADHEGKCFPSDEYLSKRLHAPERTIQMRIKKLSDLGYISRETFIDPKNPFHKKRIIIVHAEFKKPLRNAASCGSDGAASCGTDAQPTAGIVSEACLVSEEVVCKSEAPVGATDQAIWDVVTKKDFEGKEFTISLQQVFQEAVLKRKSWTTEEIKESWRIFKESSGPFRDPIGYIEGTISKIKNRKKAEYLHKKEKCQTTQQQNHTGSSKEEENSSQNKSNPPMDQDSWMRQLQEYDLEMRTQRRY